MVWILNTHRFPKQAIAFGTEATPLFYAFRFFTFCQPCGRLHVSNTGLSRKLSSMIQEQCSALSVWTALVHFQ